MRNPSTRRSTGFVLLEALIALLIVSLGLLAISKLEGLTVSAAGEARSRSEAMTLAQKKLEELRNWVTQNSFDTGMGTTGTITGNSSYTPSNANATYSYLWTISPSAGGKLVQLTTTWNDRFGVNQSLDLNSLVTWDNPQNQAKADTGFKGINAPAPSGEAKRGDYTVRPTDGSAGTVTNPGGPGNVRILDNTNTGRTELLNSAGQVVLYLDKVNGVSQSFTTISGRIYFDQSVSNFLPDSANVRVRLSSEGECFYDNTVATLNNHSVTSGANSYKYFEYKCYVGSGWYGNVGIKVDNSVNGNAANPTICVGNPDFNNGVSNNTLTSAHPDTSATRAYRGFYGTLTNGLCTVTTVNGNTSNSCFSTGVAPGRTIPNDGTVVPGTYPTNSPALGAYNQHFLLTRLTGNATCNSKMTGGEFASNAGKYFCISPDNDTAHADVCPNVWPGFTVASGGGTLNYTLSLNMSGSGSGSVTSSPVGVSCDTAATPSCTAQTVAFPSGTTVTLTPAAPSGATFAGWTGACSGTSVCTVTMSGNLTVGAQFNIGTTTHNLVVAISPSGGGGVTSSDSTISCPTTCSYDYSASSVTLHATPNTGYTFTGWSGGGCTGTSDCTVSMNSAQSVTATFAVLPTTYALTVIKTGTGSGTVTYSAGGISCGSSCIASLTSGTTVTLTAAANSGSTFTEWQGVTCSETTGNGNNVTQSNTQPTCTFTMTATKTVTAAFYTNPCITTISGSRTASAGSVSVSQPNNCSSCSCTNDTGVTSYSCSVSSAPNDTIKLTDQLTGAGSSNYNKSQTVTANCRANTNVNF